MSTSKLKHYNELYNFINENKLKLVVTVKGHITLERYTESREASTEITEFNEKYYAAIKSLVDNFLNTNNMKDINKSNSSCDYSSFIMKYPEIFDAETKQQLIKIPFDDWDYECYVDTIDDIKLSFESDYFKI